MEKKSDMGKIEIPQDAKIILNKLHENGYEAYVVGGCVRDKLLGKEPEDWDITTSAKPKEVKALFKRTIDTGIQHGTVTIMIDKVGYEVTTYRMDGEYEDHRHPKEVIFTPKLEEDLKRRDFTINAMAYNEEDGLIDIFSGIEDLKNGIVRCVGDARERFTEDALRMLRGIRFAGQLQFELEKKTYQAICEKKDLLKNVSVERIRTELSKLLLSEGSDRLMLAVESGLTKIFLPEFDVMLATDQVNPHHRLDVGRHCLEAVYHMNNLWKSYQNLPQKNKKYHIAMVYAALLHDIAKPDCKHTSEDGIDHFKGHNILGEKKSKEVLRRLKFDNETIDLLKVIIKHHDERHEFLQGNKKRRGMRRLINRVGKENMLYLFMLQKADVMSQSDYYQKEKLEKIEEAEQLFLEIKKENEPVDIEDLEISGKEIIELGIKQGPMIGEILNDLLERVLDDPEINKREKLEKIVREMLIEK